ncbi:hypothetical protein [Deinococcus hopiensis]|uniref:Uncharacterized protein n=1 Tax=Deinococcus hopiensis KR-140 TaxID=695939 RepID=A0A1W1UB24_9DEIO|nr:hypothetical protein [Deinococcus hopiensis]SMB78240.1 hypothetical protein SAMN00790413_06566 [Deinococcus hopiensis KR-140]
MEEDPNSNAAAPRAAQVYVLRMWQEGNADGVTWRASTRTGTHGERRYFASVDELLEFLYREALRV